MKQLTANKLNELLGYPVKKSKAVFTVGKGYFYRTSSLTTFKDKIEAALSAHGIKFEYIDHGDKWKPFKGGANLWSQSHYYYSFRIIE